MTRLGALLCILGALAAARPAAAQDLVVDLSQPVVEITTGFAGSSLLLFGAVQGEGDIVVAVRGPLGNEKIRRKERIGGVWVNRDAMEFTNVPAFYAVVANRPIAQILPDAQRISYQIGLRYLELVPLSQGRSPEDPRAFREALLRNKQRAGLYIEEANKIAFVGGRLFRTHLYFPGNIPFGTYVVDVYLVRRGAVAGVKTTLLEVQKIGFEANIYDFALRYALAYGLLAIAMAAMAGWLAGVLFRKT